MILLKANRTDKWDIFNVVLKIRENPWTFRPHTIWKQQALKSDHGETEDGDEQLGARAFASACKDPSLAYLWL